jgi:predicted GNAT family acetyltransferase
VGTVELVERLEFFDDADAFLAAAGDHLAADPVQATVVATVAQRESANAAAGIARPVGAPRWYLVTRDSTGAVSGAGMRTARFAPHPLFLLSMPAGAAVALARILVERGEEVGGVNGSLPAARLCADEIAHLTGHVVTVAQHTRLFELGELVPPPVLPAGRLRVAEPSDLDLVLEWFDAFMRDADEQGGREPGSSPYETPPSELMMSRIERGRVFLWVDESGEPVHLTEATLPAFGVSRLGPVYTPPQQRGKNYASAAVAEVSRLITAEGSRACLFTDQANPTSNAIYMRLGYRPVVDMANLIIE